jgi:hypothetical protein
VVPRAGLDDMEKWKFLTLQRLELRPLGRPARSQSLYRLLELFILILLLQNYGDSDNGDDVDDKMITRDWFRSYLFKNVASTSEFI